MGKNNSAIVKKPASKPSGPAPRAVVKTAVKADVKADKKTAVKTVKADRAVKKPKMFDRLTTKPTVDRDAQRREVLDNQIARKESPVHGMVMNRKKDSPRYGISNLKGGI